MTPPRLPPRRILDAGTSEICVVRHGETDWNAAGVLQGWLDVPLNDLGRLQARQLGDMFRDEGFCRIFTSPLGRALETARIVHGAIGGEEPVVLPDLRERNFGEIQGVTKTQLAEQNPALLQEILRRNPACEFSGGETMDQFADRILSVLTNIGQRARGTRVLIIAHGWAMDVITREALGLSRGAILAMKRKNVEPFWLLWRDDGLSVE